MRVIAGTLGGRNFDSPHSNRTHPMSDKMRGALFGTMGDIEGLTVLDPFAGSGALSFEAVSRGAISAVAVEADRPAQHIIAANIKSLRLQRRVKLISASTNAWLQTNPNATFDLILCDPPYDDRQPNLLQRLSARVKSDGVFVLSWPSAEPLPEFANLVLARHKTYGDASLAFYKLKEGGSNG